MVATLAQEAAPPEALAGGARGAGHNVNSSRTHEEPDEIYVVGTSHISQQSAEDVERVIRAVQPDNVVVELCRSRAGMMYTEETGSETGAQTGAAPLAISGANPLQAIGRSVALGGPWALLLRVALAKNSALAQTFSQTGADFRAARRAAEAAGATIVLGDRPIEITIERSWGALSRGEKVRPAPYTLNPKPQTDPSPSSAAGRSFPWRKGAALHPPKTSPRPQALDPRP